MRIYPIVCDVKMQIDGVAKDITQDRVCSTVSLIRRSQENKTKLTFVSPTRKRLAQDFRCAYQRWSRSAVDAPKDNLYQDRMKIKEKKSLLTTWSTRASVTSWKSISGKTTMSRLRVLLRDQTWGESHKRGARIERFETRKEDIGV